MGAYDNHAISKIISGGQTGVDRAALDFAMEHNIACRGWCPKGRLAEDGEIPTKYPLQETVSRRYEKRTKKNVIDSDGTLIITDKEPLSLGTKLTMEICQKHQKPYLILHSEPSTDAVQQFWAWVSKNAISVLNIAGPRESTVPGIYKQSGSLLTLLWH
ncbi:putative molybdenum carrier protein [Fulvivirgaceae bacterium BMA12]|uniref:Molybdenum carrier protein n=1 Tax=Agaribacillus aureus TaxID=3051825 RepID=A0ABT8LE50_9BACT|nr:putative molybdenum carrier protein [Fulvivirgaceae bacterium BMA12]